MNHKKNQDHPALVVFSAALFFFYIFIQLNIFNTLNLPLMTEFHVSAWQLGMLSSFYFYATIPLLFPAGILLDYFSTRKIILLAMMAITLATFIFAITTHFWLVALCRFLTGISGSFGLLSCVRLATRWYPPRHMALVIGLIVTLGMLGGMVAQTPLSWLIEMIGWRSAVLWNGGLGLVIIVIIALFVRDYPAHPTTKTLFHSKSTIDFRSSLRLALTNKQNWYGGLYTSFLNLPIFLLGGLWGNLFLIQAHHLSAIQASYACSMLFVGTIIGSPVLGWLSDHLRLRRQPMIICAMISLIIILLMMFSAKLNLMPAMVLFFLLGFFTSAQIISYPLIAESNPSEIIGTAEGIASCLIMAGGITQSLFGWLMELRWNGSLINKMPIYSLSDYRLAMSIMPIGFVLGLMMAILLRETYGQNITKKVSNLH